MILKNHAVFWGITLVLCAGFLVLFSDVLLPFVLGMTIAYLLNPAVERCGQLGLSRAFAAFLILGLFFAVIGLLIILAAPILYREILTLSQDLPAYSQQIWEQVKPFSQKIEAMILQKSDQELQELAQAHAGSAVRVVKEFLESMIAGGNAVLSGLSVLIFTPIVAYFMMKEWKHITTWGVSLMPKDQKQTMTDLLEKIDAKVSGFIRGQLSVALILGVGYALALSLIGLKYGFLIGIVSGLLSVIPMVGSFVGLLVGIIVAWLQSSDWVFVLSVGGVFIAGQLIEGNILTPRLVGKSVGLHPLWVFFALMAGGSLFGILGMFLAVPAAAVIGVLAAFGIAQYKASPYYKGKSSPKKKANTKKTAKTKKT